MRREFVPYYLSRAVLSAIFAVIAFGFDWKAAVFACALFGLFLLYLHSGWFIVDPARPLTPLRRDSRGREIQRKALIASLVVGLLIYIVSSRATALLDLSYAAGSLAVSLGVITYFVTQFTLLARR